MKDPETNDFPFLTRKMLDFEFAATFALKLDLQSLAEGDFIISGATKAGVFKYVFSSVGNGSAETATFNLDDVPIFVSVTSPAGAVNKGIAYAILSLIINGDLVHQLAGGNVYALNAISWPNTGIKEPGPDIGNIEDISVDDPATGAEIFKEVPSRTIWKVKGVRFNFTTAAAAANRVVHLLFTRGGVVFAECICPTTQIISQNRNYTAYPTNAGASMADDNDIIIPIPNDIILGVEDEIKTLTTAINAGDAFTGVKIIVESFVYPR